jgi:hypothetical protein
MAREAHDALRDFECALVGIGSLQLQAKGVGQSGAVQRPCDGRLQRTAEGAPERGGEAASIAECRVRQSRGEQVITCRFASGLEEPGGEFRHFGGCERLAGATRPGRCCRPARKRWMRPTFDNREAGHDAVLLMDRSVAQQATCHTTTRSAPLRATAWPCRIGESGFASRTRETPDSKPDSRCRPRNNCRWYAQILAWTLLY